MHSRILYVITDLQLGGVPLHLHRLSVAMRARGFQPTVVSLAGSGPVGRMLRADGIEVLSCKARGRWDLRVVRRLAAIIKTLQPDIVHALLFHANFAARRAARKTGFPSDRLLCEIQTVEVERKWHLWVDRWTHRGCRFTIGNSPSVVEHLAARAGIPRERLRLIRGGIDPTPLREATPIDRTGLGLDAHAPIVLWVGRLDPVKGLDILIQAFRLIAADESRTQGRAREAHLLLAGDGPLRNRLLRRINQSGLTSRVHLLGSRDDVPALLKAADVFVLPSRTEGLPNALLEAMAAECPIVTTDVPGCRDLIEHERTGILVPYGDTAALAEAITTLLNDRATARRLARSASDIVTQQWHINRTHNACAALYAEVLAGG